MKTTISLAFLGMLAFLSGCGESGARTERISCLDDLNRPNCVIACLQDSRASLETKKRLPAATYQDYLLPADCAAALSSGRAVAIVNDRPTLEYMLADRPDCVMLSGNVATGHIAVVTRKGNARLIAQVNDFIRRFRADGTYDSMYGRWIRTLSTAMPDIAKPAAPKGRLVIGTDGENPPTSYVLNGELTGYDVEFGRRLALDLGLEVEFKLIPFEGLVAALSGNKIDLAIAQMDARPEREENMLFSEDYIDAPIAMVILRRNYAGAGDDLAGVGGIAAFLKDIAASFSKTFLRESRWRMILQGLGVTVVITFFSVLLGTLLAFPLCIGCRARFRLVSACCKRLVSLVMGTPTLVTLMILYYVVFARVDVSSILVAVICFALEFAVYASVALGSAIDGVSPGQTEAALALGHRPAMAFLRFVLPQAVRAALPVYCSTIVATLKGTSIVGYIAIVDLTKVGDLIRSRTYEAFFPLIATAVIYFVVAKALTGTLELLERWMRPECRRNRMRKEVAR